MNIQSYKYMYFALFSRRPHTSGCVYLMKTHLLFKSSNTLHFVDDLFYKESKLNLSRDCMHNPFQIPIKYYIKYLCVNLNIRRAFNATMRAEF